MTELLPRKASFTPGETARIEVRGDAAGTVRVWHLGELVSETVCSGGEVVLPPLPAGGYSVELGDLTTAVEIAADPRARLRYGFVANYAPDRNVTGVADLVRRLHLTGVQFYDWAYRHADLLGGGEQYDDALGQPIALGTVRRLIDAVHAAGSRALGYAAVYGVGRGEWADWSHDGLLRADGTNWSLGDFLYVVDPAAPDWLRHFNSDLVKATATLGFDGFHLDQYGWPKTAIRADGAAVDTAASFVALIDGVRAALPGAHLVFNNVNDFPTRLTARAAQDAVYIEPWAPQVTLQSLADTAARARLYGDGKPVVFAAYQHVYESVPAEVADRSTSLTMATLFSHGATQLLAGEADRLLSDPYYVRNRVMEQSTQDLLKRWYDFLVAHDELLMPPAITEVTHSYVGGYNGDLDVTFPTGVTETATAGRIWRRATRAGDRLVVHLINLADQADTLWDAPRAPFTPQHGTLRVRSLKDRTPTIRVADPDGTGRLVGFTPAMNAEAASVDLPPLHVWQLISIEL